MTHPDNVKHWFQLADQLTDDQLLVMRELQKAGRRPPIPARNR